MKKNNTTNNEAKSTELSDLNERIVITEAIVLLNPYLFEGKSFNGQPVKYGTGIGVLKDDYVTLDKINNAIDETIKNGNFTKCDKIKLPLRDGDKEYPNKQLYHNSYFLYATSDTKPEVVDHNLKLNLGGTSVSHGDYAKVCISFEPYNIKENKGISCRLIAVQTLNRKSRSLELRPDINTIFKVER